MATATDLAEAVHATLSAATLTGTPTVTLAYLPIFTDEGQASAAPQVVVYLGSRTWTIENRCQNATKEPVINVAIREYLAPGSDGKVANSSITTMLDLVEQVVDVMLAAGTQAGYRLISIEEAQPFDFQRVFEAGYFENMISFTFKGQ